MCMANELPVLRDKLLSQLSVWKATPNLTQVIASIGMLTRSQSFTLF